MEARDKLGTALLRGLRRRGDEAQFTQVLYSLAAGEPTFASEFVKVLLDAARVSYGAAVERLGPVPERLSCRAEVGLGAGLGRLDLRFDGEPDFTLFVENKLFSGYGDQQVARYLAALRLLPPGRRAALVAVTRDIPGYGEPLAAEPGWLGSVRWAKLLPALRQLPLPATLTDQWKLLLDLMYEDGDLGMIKPDTGAIEAWAKHAVGREELAKLLRQVRGLTFETVRDHLAGRYSGKPVDALVAHHTFGKRGKVDVKHELTKTWIGFRVPASETTEPGLVVQFSNYFRRPLLMVEAWPFVDTTPDPLLTAATTTLRQTPDVYENRGAWGRAHEADVWLHRPDVPAAIAELVTADVALLLDSGIFDADIAAMPRQHRGLGRWRRTREGDE